MTTLDTTTDATRTTDSLQDILDMAVTVEMLGITLVGAGLDSNARGNFDPPIPPPLVAVLTAARGQEQSHYDFFRSLGGRPLVQEFHVPDPALLTDPNVFFGALQVEEARETAAHIAALAVFTALGRPDLVKVSCQYAAEEAEHRLLTNYAAGARPANNYAFSPAFYRNGTEILEDLRQQGIIGGSGPAVAFPGPGTIDYTNVTERTPGGAVVAF